MAGSDRNPDNDMQLAAYGRLLENARAMLEAARGGRWDELVSLNEARTVHMAEVRNCDLISTRPADIAAQAEMIQGILDCDEQTRVLAHARQVELSEVLESLGNERKLADAYR